MTGKSALLVVDVQNDFCPGGALAVSEGDQVVDVLNDYIERFQSAGLPIYASRDWHPEVTRHFSAHGGTWPVHCVADTRGASFHDRLQLPPDTPVISKGTSGEDDGYSAFEGTLDSGEDLADLLQRDGVDHLYVGGLATDYCVRASVLDARKRGLQVTLLADAVRGVEVRSGDVERAIAEMRAAGADTITLAQLSLSTAGG